MRILSLVWKEFIQLRRNILLSFFILLIPMFEFALMSRVTGSEIKDITVAVLDLDRSKASRELIRVVDETRRLKVAFYPRSQTELEELISRGEATIGLIIPQGFSSELSQIYAILDGSFSTPASLGLSGLYEAIEAFSNKKLREAGVEAKSKVNLETRILFNPTYDVRHFTLPAMVGFIVYQITIAIASLSLVRERELGTIEQLLVSPLRREEIILGKGLVAFLAGFVNFWLILLLATKIYHVPFRGSILLLGAITALFLVVESGWGLALSTLARNPQQAILFVFIQVMVDVAFSGFIVPVKNLPAHLRFIAFFVPLQHYLFIIRSIMLKGASFFDLLPRIGVLLLLGAFMLITASLNLRRSLE
jgi:ABC-2 type transport system permease protein